MSNANFQKAVAEILIDIESVKFSFNKPFTLTSGLKSPVYVDCRKIISFVNERNTILNFALQYFKNNSINFDIIAGGETAGIPYAAFFSELLQKPMIYVRKKPKGFGINKQIEGYFKNKQKVVLIEDLATDGKSKAIFIQALREAKLYISDIFVVFNYDIFDVRNSPLASLDVTIHSLCTWKNIFDVLMQKNIFSNAKLENLKSFLNDPNKWRSNQ